MSSLSLRRAALRQSRMVTAGPADLRSLERPAMLTLVSRSDARLWTVLRLSYL